ncbi:sodium-dependent phosphate transporter [Anopheles darlingi]|uniref:Sodium-dependent phosphate transporter n=1 Tax=Anopheles darlingi TaxID=43151 RepID=W5JFJ2_ANODA|nr:sialin-like [Anopheles darlingi]ETN61579.1 sodium-dependent phosphate transporter [Anopheles darlingi]
MPSLLNTCMGGICCCAKQHILVMMAFFAIFNQYTMRVCLHLAITVMTGDQNATVSGVEIPDEDRFDWDEHEQGIILSSFYWGYTLSHFASTFVADHYSKHLLGVSVLITAIFTLLTPLAIDYGGAWLLVVFRVIEGIGEGATFPVLSVLVAHWVPANRRGFFGSFIFSGCQIGALAGGIGTGYFIQAHGTWRTTFYIWGVLALVWYIVWLLIGYESPETHPYISEQEKSQLLEQLADSKKSSEKLPIPWRRIFTSVPLWGLIAGQIGHDWGTYLIITDLPKYMNSILQFSVADNGIVTYGPFFSMWLFSILGGWLADLQIKKRCMSRTNARKLWTTIGSLLPAIFLMLASYTGANKVPVVMFFALCVTFLGGFYPGVKVNSNDLSPNFAGVLMGMVNGIGAITGILTPYIAGLLTPNQTIEEWRIVFWIAFVVLNVTNILFLMFASGDIQPWNYPAGSEQPQH